ncbi:MAG: DnaJ C-terminal domain-containing protein [Myxococcota bacterium]
MVSRSYYQELGVSEGASQDEIKRAYRKLARQFHPDHNPGNKGAEERFKRIGHAFEVLSNPEKRRMYDEMGEDAEKFGFDAAKARAYRQGGRPGGGGKGGGDPLEDLLRNFGGGGGGRPAATRSRPVAGSDIKLDVTIGFEEAARGGERTVRLTKPQRCDGCSGDGRTSKRSVCTDCGGSGQTAFQQGATQFSSPCPTCGGTGRQAEICGGCGGRGTRPNQSRLNVKVPAGVDDGQTIRLRGQGGPGLRGGRDGDLRITVKVAAHPYFERSGRDLTLDVPLTLPEALLGAQIEIPTLDGPVHLKVPPGTQSGAKLRLKGRGAGPEGQRGDLFAKIAVRLPDTSKDPEAIKAAAERLAPLYADDIRARWTG